MKQIKKGVDFVMKIAENLLWILLSIAVVCVVLQIFSRYVLGNSFTWTEQAARYLFIWMVMIGCPVMFHHRIFIAFDLILMVLPEKVQYVINLIIKVCTMAFSCYYFYWSLQLVIQTMGRHTSGFEVPFWALYGAQPVFCVLLFVCMLGLICEDLMNHKAALNPAEVKEDVA